MSEITAVLNPFFLGVKDAISVPYPVIVLLQSPSIRRRAALCVILNGVLFLGSILLLDWVIRPVLHVMLALAGVVENVENSLPVMSVVDAGADEPVGFIDSILSTIGGVWLVSRSTRASGSTVVSAVDWSVSAFYHVFWVYPVYCLSFVLNALFYNAIAEKAYRMQIGTPAAPKAGLREFIRGLSDELFRALMFGTHLGLTFLVYNVPVIGPIMSFLFLNWLYAYYCFEYKWIMHGWDFQKRIVYFENHWAFFAGFGAPYTLLTYAFPALISYGLYAILFPMLIILANTARPVVAGPPWPQRMFVFLPAQSANVLIIRLLSWLRLPAPAGPSTNTPDPKDLPQEPPVSSARPVPGLTTRAIDHSKSQ